MVYFSNPDNPMGTWWNAAAVARLHRGACRDDSLLVPRRSLWRDRAARQPCRRSTSPIRNVLRFRTFSKAYGLAGARFGYAIGEAGVICAFDKIRNHFGVNRIAQVAALAALADKAYLAKGAARSLPARERIAAIGRANGLEAAAVGHQFRHHGLRPRRRLCA